MLCVAELGVAMDLICKSATVETGCDCLRVDGQGTLWLMSRSSLSRLVMAVVSTSLASASMLYAIFTF